MRMMSPIGNKRTKGNTQRGAIIHEKEGLGYIEVLTAVSILLISTVFLIRGLIMLSETEQKSVMRLWAMDGFSLVQAHLWTWSESQLETTPVRVERFKINHGPRTGVITTRIQNQGRFDETIVLLDTSVAISMNERNVKGYEERRLGFVYNLPDKF